ncbi:MAG: hypothetical protein HY889_08235 [Deltaproteobacteria bacterium]|nr:hypothetical protein [Deltaproteobacteria bacterium]
MGIDWKAVKEEFDSGSASVVELAKKYGLHRSTIGKRIKKEGWRKKSDFAESESRSTAVLKPEDLLDDHRVLWKGVKKRLVRGLHNNDVKLGLEELKVAKMAGEVLSSVIKGERLAWGIEDDACANLDDTEKIVAEMELATVPGRAGEAVDGE